MRELERDSSSDTPACRHLAVLGAGRLGRAMASALAQAGYEVSGPLGRGADAAGADAALLCVPDDEITPAAELVAPGVIVGHCSGATGLGALGDREGFSLHPLMTVTLDGALLRGAGAAIAGTTIRAREVAAQLARDLGMLAVQIDEEDRAAYHAAASMASNFLITLEAAAEQLAAGVGVERELLVPLVRAAVENWAQLGPERALTGPVARGDEGTLARQRHAVAERTPEFLELFDVLTDATRALAAAARVGAP